MTQWETKGRAAGAALVVALLMLALWGAQAQAAPGCTPEDSECPPLGIQFGTYGDAAGGLNYPRGLATDWLTGHVYVGEGGNARISEFDEKGDFAKAWGWGVVASGPGNLPRNEIQLVSVDATAGTFRLRYRAGPFQISSSISFDASAAAVKSALETMTSSNPAPANMSAGSGDLTVSGPDGGPWQIAFTGANADVDMFQFQINSSTLSGGTGAIVETVQAGAGFEVCRVVDGDVCRAGQVGAQTGHLSDPQLAVDTAGDVWVLGSDLRLQKFSSEGEFLLTVGGEANKTKVVEREEQEENLEPVTVTEVEENLCTAASGDECGAATSGTGQGQFKVLGAGNAIASGPGGIIYAGDENRIQEFDEEGNWLGEIPLPGAGVTRALTVTPSGRIFVISEGVKEDISNGYFDKPSRVVRVIGSSGVEVGHLNGLWQERKTPREPAVLASDAEGNVYVVGQVVYDAPVDPGKDPEYEELEEILAFDEEGDLIQFGSGQAGFGRPPDTSGMVSIATNVKSPGSEEPGPVLLGHADGEGLGSIGGPKSYVRTFGQFGPRDPEPPEIVSQYATAVSAEDASVEAQISPSFAKDTTFWVEYGTGKCSEGGCEAVTASAPLKGTVNDTPQGTGEVPLVGLAPATTYHFRFVAESEGGGPVQGAEAAFTTYPLSTGPPPCPNDPLRAGAGALLPDCRAYELVSPLDKDGGEAIALSDTPGYPAELTQGDPAGGKLTYSSYRAFADPTSAPFTSQYLAKRQEDGWATEPISPPREEVLFADLRNQFRLFSPDLSRAWLQSDSEPVLAPGGLKGYRNLYRRDNVDGGYAMQCATEPVGAKAADFRLEVQGASADGSHLVFRANGKLIEGAAETGVAQLYECVDGNELRLVSVLPGGGAAEGASTGDASSPGLDSSHRKSNVTGAVSADGSRIFWTAATFGAGPLHARIDGAVTVEIAASGARFRQASVDGTRVIYTVGDELLAATVGSESAGSETIAREVEGVMGVNEDAQLLYFVSREDLDASGEAQPGEPNLYLHRAAPNTYTFIARLSEYDTQEEIDGPVEMSPLTPVARSPYQRSARVTADGLHAAFTSTAPLTGYDNTDVVSGKANAEVFVYDAEAAQLRCASCNPSGARPRGAEVGEPNFWAAAIIPGWEDQFHASRALSEDGGRLFFEAVDALALGDTNGVTDVYQWEEPGHGGCNAASPTYSAPTGGCIDLISSGKSPEPSTLVDASADGADVFFKTAASLWAPDPGLVDIYDARIGGGFPVPPALPLPCEGDACQSPAPPPLFQSPASGAYVGPGDQPSKGKKKAGKRRCPKGKHKVKRKGKVRCIKNSKKKRGSHRRAAR